MVHPGGGSGETDETVSRSKAEEPPADSLEDFRCWILQRLGIARHLKSKIKTNFVRITEERKIAGKGRGKEKERERELQKIWNILVNKHFVTRTFSISNPRLLVYLKNKTKN